MIAMLEQIENTKVSLSVPLVASFLTKQLRQRDIARACNVSDQAVSQYIRTHADKLAPLLDHDSGLPAMMSKHIAVEAKGKLKTILEVETFTKKDIVPLNILAGTQDDKYRLLSDKSTQNMSINTVTDNIKDIQAQIKAIKDGRNNV